MRKLLVVLVMGLSSLAAALPEGPTLADRWLRVTVQFRGAGQEQGESEPSWLRRRFTNYVRVAQVDNGWHELEVYAPRVGGGWIGMGSEGAMTVTGDGPRAFVNFGELLLFPEPVSGEALDGSQVFMQFNGPVRQGVDAGGLLRFRMRSQGAVARWTRITPGPLFEAFGSTRIGMRDIPTAKLPLEVAIAAGL